MGVAEGLSALVIGLRDLIDLVLVVSILILVIILLKIIERSYKTRLEIRERDRNLFYRREVMKIRDMRYDPQRVLDRVNIVARGFFKEAFNLPYHLEYLELVEEFKKLGKADGVSFCRFISELNYSGDELNAEKLSRLLWLLERLMKTNRIKGDLQNIPLKKKSSRERTNEKTKEEPTPAPSAWTEASASGISQTPLGKRKDINHINWRYRIRIFLLRIRGRMPQIRKIRLEGQKPVSGINKYELSNEYEDSGKYEVGG